jgi:hypothetical protein
MRATRSLLGFHHHRATSMAIQAGRLRPEGEDDGRHLLVLGSVAIPLAGSDGASAAT